MDRRERVIAAIQHKDTDIVPYWADFTGIEEEKMIKYTGNPDFVNSFGKHIDYTTTMDFRYKDPKDNDYEYDEFGSRWYVGKEDIGIVVGCPLKDKALWEYDFPEPDESKIRANIESMLNNGRDTFKMVNIGFTMYERAWALRGIEDVLCDMVAEPEFLEGLMKKITDYDLACMEIAMTCGDFDAFESGDDWGQQRGLIMGRPHWEHYIRPGMQRIFDYAHEHGKFIIHHACGDNNELLGPLTEMGLDVYETFQPEVYDIVTIKKTLGDRLAFLGGISTQALLPVATPDVVKSETRRIMEIMSVSGGYIAAPTHAVPWDVPEENVMAMLDVFMNQ